MFYDRPMSDTLPPPPGPGQQGYGSQGGADVWGDDPNGRVGFGNRLEVISSMPSCTAPSWLP